MDCEVQTLDAFLVPPGGFGVVISRRGPACLVLMQNGIKGYAPTEWVAQWKLQLEHLLAGGGAQ